MSDRYLKLFTSIGRHPKWRLRLREDGARVAYIIALCEAKDAGSDGRFESREHLELVLGAYGTHIDHLIEAGLVDEIPDTGELWMHDFEERQRPKTNAERQAGWRTRHGAGRSPNGDDSGDDGGDDSGDDSGGSGGPEEGSPHGDNAVDNEARNAGRYEKRNDGRYSPRNAGVTNPVTLAVTKSVTRPVTNSVTPIVTHKERRVDKIRKEYMGKMSANQRVIDVYQRLFRVTPSTSVERILLNETRDHGADRVVDAITAEAPEGRTDAIKRIGRRLRREAKERHATEDANRRRSEKNESKLERPAGMTEELAAENRAAIAAFVQGFKMQGEG